MGWIFGRDKSKVGALKQRADLNMAKFDKNQIAGAYETVLRSKFGDLYDWEQTTLVDTVGPYNPEVFESVEHKRNDLLKFCFDILQKTSIEELLAISEVHRRDETGTRDAWKSLCRPEIRELGKQRPHWASGGFGNAEYAADFEYWARMPRLSEHEAVAPTFGVEPKHFEAFARLGR